MSAVEVLTEGWTPLKVASGGRRLAPNAAREDCVDVVVASQLQDETQNRGGSCVCWGDRVSGRSLTCAVSAVDWREAPVDVRGTVGVHVEGSPLVGLSDRGIFVTSSVTTLWKPLAAALLSSSAIGRSAASCKLSDVLGQAESGPLPRHSFSTLAAAVGDVVPTAASAKKLRWAKDVRRPPLVESMLTGFEFSPCGSSSVADSFISRGAGGAASSARSAESDAGPASSSSTRASSSFFEQEPLDSTSVSAIESTCASGRP